MLTKHDRVLWEGFKAFYLFSPAKQIFIFCLMLIQSVTAGIGFLLILPLLQIVGIDLGGTSSTPISKFVEHGYRAIGLEPKLSTILLCYIVIISIMAALRFQLRVLSTEVQQAYISYLRDRLYRHLLHCRWQFIVENKMSDFIHSLSGQVQSISQASHLMLNLLSQVILCLVMLALVLLLSWQMTVLALLIGSILLAILLPLNRLIYHSGHKQISSFKSIFQMFTEQLASLKMIKSYSSENYYAQQVRQESQTLELQQLNLVRINALTQAIYSVGSVVAFSIFFFIGQKSLAIPLATLLLLLIILSRLLPQLSSILKSYQQLLHKVPAFEDISEMTIAFEQAKEPDISSNQCPTLNQTLKVKDLTYIYPNVQKPVLDNLSFEIKRNQTIALVGPSGSGKSTLADLLAGLLEPTCGTINCDDEVLENEKRIAWRQRIAYVTQEVYLFNDTVRANLSWVANSDKVTDDDLWIVLEKVAAIDFVKLLPQGLDTVVGDRGVKLSGGERQRLALARALLASPQLLILDEATSALDHENEQKIQQALRQLQGSLTIIIIAHRETTISHADQHIKLGTTRALNLNVD